MDYYINYIIKLGGGHSVRYLWLRANKLKFSDLCKFKGKVEFIEQAHISKETSPTSNSHVPSYEVESL